MSKEAHFRAGNSEGTVRAGIHEYSFFDIFSVFIPQREAVLVVSSQTFPTVSTLSPRRYKDLNNPLSFREWLLLRDSRKPALLEFVD